MHFLRASLTDAIPNSGYVLRADGKERKVNGL